jgi:hypothetical protein
MRRGLLIAAFLLAAMTPVFAQPAAENEQDEQNAYLYQWTDDGGVVHVTDGLGKVPARFQSKARRLEAAPEAGAAPSQPAQQGVSSSPDNRQEQRESEQKALWQRRMQEAKSRIAAATQHYQEIEQRRTALLGPWGTPAYAPPQVRLEAERAAEEMQRVQREIDDARHEAEVIIPEEARKAGVPPGWLRE